MSKVTRTDSQSPAPHLADRHDLIHVHGARVNNLKDVSIEIPKRRLTVFTGVSGSGKTSYGRRRRRRAGPGRRGVVLVSTNDRGLHQRSEHVRAGTPDAGS